MLSGVFVHGLISPFLGANCYLVAEQQPGPCLVIDPGAGLADSVVELCRARGWQVAGVVATHAHPDHVWDAAAICSRFNVPCYLHPLDQDLLADPVAALGSMASGLSAELQRAGFGPWWRPEQLKPLTTPDDGPLTVAGIDLRLQHAPGHSPGSSLIRIDPGPGEVAGVLAAGGSSPLAGSELVFSGDVLFAGSVGRTDLAGGAPAQMRATLAALTTSLPQSATLLPGHGPATTMAAEMRHNPYLTH